MHFGYAQCKQKGFVQFLILGIVGLIIVAAGAFYLGKQVAAPKPQPQTSVAQPTISQPSPSLTPVPDETANWKTYTAKDNEFSFRYPSNWYYKLVPGYESREVSFFVNGTQAVHRYGDGEGNEVLTVEITDESRSLQTLKSNIYSNANLITVAGKPAMKTPFGLIIVQVAKNRQLKLTGGYTSDAYVNEKGVAKAYVEIILSTLRFTDKASSSEACKTTGCNKELCSDKDLFSPCVIKAEYGCYGSAKCERQVNGKCGWTQTEESNKCLGKF